MKIRSPSAGAVVEAAVRVSVSVPGRPRSVAFYLDGRRKSIERRRPYRYRGRGVLKASRLSAGRHRLTVVARYRGGPKRAASRVITVAGPRAMLGRGWPTAPVAGGPPPLVPGPGSPSEPPLWRGDFETGSLSQWELVQRPSAARIQVVRSPVAEGRFAVRFEARQGEFTGDDVGSNRSEIGVVRYDDGSRDREGDERWYRWFTRLAPDFPSDYPGAHASIMQWKRDDNQNPLPLGFGIRGPDLRIASNGTRYLGPISRGVWHEFLVHAKWSTDPGEGFIEVFLDGEEIVPKVHLQNMYTDPSGEPILHYIKQGLYKSDAIPTTYVDHDGMTIGNTRESVGG